MFKFSISTITLAIGLVIGIAQKESLQAHNIETVNQVFTDSNSVATLKPFLLKQGKASWYGGRFHRRKTASGERFNMYDFTAAHRKLPFGTLVVVKDRATQKSVVVRINDRGPFIRSKIIDLSKSSAEYLGGDLQQVEIKAFTPNVLLNDNDSTTVAALGRGFTHLNVKSQYFIAKDTVTSLEYVNNYIADGSDTAARNAVVPKTDENGNMFFICGEIARFVYPKLPMLTYNKNNF